MTPEQLAPRLLTVRKLDADVARDCCGPRDCCAAGRWLDEFDAASALMSYPSLALRATECRRSGVLLADP